MNYHEYISSKAWTAKKLEAYAVKGSFCERCGDNRKKFLNVHHLHYRTLGQENVRTDLGILCRNCHAEYHVKFGPKPDEFTFKKFITWKPQKDLNGTRKQQIVIKVLRRQINSYERQDKKAAARQFQQDKWAIRKERAKAYLAKRMEELRQAKAA